MGKGFNTTVIETKNMILNDINKALSDGVPITVIQLILEALLNNTKLLVENVVVEESKSIEEEETEV